MNQTQERVLAPGDVAAASGPQELRKAWTTPVLSVASVASVTLSVGRVCNDGRGGGFARINSLCI